MTFKELQDDALEACGYDNTVASSTPRTRFKRAINYWHRRILTDSRFSRLLRESYSYTFASVAAQAVYGLPISNARILNITETENDLQLQHRSLDWLRSEDPGLEISGTPNTWVPRGWFPVHTQPSNASAITFKSSAAGDVTQKLYVEYLNAAGQVLTTNVMIVGTTDTTLIASGCVEILALYLDAVCTGTVTVYEDSDAGTALAVIPIGKTSVKHFHIQLWPAPGGATTYTVDLTRKLSNLVNNNEEPLLPEDFHEVLSMGAQADEWRLKDDSRYQLVRADLKDRLNQLNHTLWVFPNLVPVPRAMERVGHSRLGGWFPKGS